MIDSRFAKYIDLRKWDETFMYYPTGSRVRRAFSTPPPSHYLDEVAPVKVIEEWVTTSDEAPEWTALFEALEGAKDSFTMVELGAGFGRWLVAAAVAIRRVRNIPFFLIGVEAEHGHFEMMRQHFIDNEVDPSRHTLIEAAVTEQDGIVHFVQGHSEEWWGQAVLPSPNYGFGNWPKALVTSVPGLSLSTILRDVETVDLIDMDVQGAEADVVRGGRAILEKVKRVCIGTHNEAVEADLRTVFGEMNWLCTADRPCGELTGHDGVQAWVNPKR
jgi:FkbM family methyltransferase